MEKLYLNVAGEIFPVLFDGTMVSSPEFPNEPIDYVASCGMRITQEMLVESCKRKQQKQTKC